MHKVLLDQGSEEWLKWRRSLLTATDAAMLLGESPYVTPYKGWQRKLGLIPEQVANSAMKRGQRDEPVARALFVEEYGINMTPCCIESEKYNYIGASLDGLSDCETIILEIKSQAPVKEVPLFHKMQIYHQMIATDFKATKAYYVSHWEGVNTTFELEIDMEWVNKYLPQASEFWRRVLFFDPPAMTNKDYQYRGDILTWNHLAKEYKEVTQQIKALEDKKDFLRKEIIALCAEESSSGGGIKALKKITKGRIDLAEAVEILNISNDQLEQFRKPPSTSWLITIEK